MNLLPLVLFSLGFLLRSGFCQKEKRSPDYWIDYEPLSKSSNPKVRSEVTPGQSEYGDVVYKDTGVDVLQAQQAIQQVADIVAKTGTSSQVCYSALDLVIILDASYTMEGVAWDEEKRTVYTLLDKLDVSTNHTHVAVIVMSTNAVVSVSLNGYKDVEELKGKIGSLEYTSGWSRTDQALLAAKYEVLTPNGGSRSGIPKAVVIFTDGTTDGPNDSLDWKKKLVETSNDLKNDGVNVLCIGTDQADSAQLKTIASDPANVFLAMDIDKVVTTLQKMSKEVCYEEKPTELIQPAPQPQQAAPQPQPPAPQLQPPAPQLQLPAPQPQQAAQQPQQAAPQQAPYPSCPGCVFPSICLVAVQPTCLPPTSTSTCTAPSSCTNTATTSCPTPGVCTATHTTTATSTALLTTTSTDVQTSTAVTTLSSTIVDTSTAVETLTHTATTTDTETLTSTAIHTSTHVTTATDTTTQTHHQILTSIAVATSTATDTTTQTLSTTNTHLTTATTTATATSTGLATRYVTNTLLTTSIDVATSTHYATETLTSTHLTTKTDTSTAVTTATETATLTTTSTALTTSTHVTTDVSTHLTTKTLTDTSTATHTTTHTTTDYAIKTSTAVVSVTDTLTQITTATDTKTATSTAIKTSFTIATATSTLTATETLKTTQINVQTSTHVTTATITATQTSTATATSTAVTTTTDTHTQTEVLTTVSTKTDTSTQIKTDTSTVMSTRVVTTCSANCPTIVPTPTITVVPSSSVPPVVPPKPGCLNTPMDIGLVIDAYDGFTDNDFTNLKLFVADLVSKFTVNYYLTRFAIITYGGKAEIKVKFNEVPHLTLLSLQEKIKGLPRLQSPGHWTDDALLLSSSLFTADNGYRESMPSVLIVFAAANTNVQSTSYPEAIIPLLEKKVKIIAVGVSDIVSDAELNAMANGITNNVFSVKNYGSLGAMVGDITSRTCNTTETDPGDTKCKAEYHKRGCYNFDPKSPILKELVHKDTPDQENFVEWLKTFVCKCAEKAKDLNYKAFSVIANGECYSDKDALESYGEHGRSTKCYDGKWKSCVDNNLDECTGANSTMYIYGPKLPVPPAPKPCNYTLDVGFVVDGSNSISSSNFIKCKKFIKDVVQNFNVSQRGTHIGAVLFSKESNVVFNFKQHYDIPSINKAIDDMIQPKSYTNIAGALEMARTGLFDPSGRNQYKRVLIVMTDGQSTVNGGKVPEEAKKLKDTGVNIISLGIGNAYDQNELEVIASDPVKYYVFTSGFDQLDSLVQVIKDQVCQGNTTVKTVKFLSGPETLYVRAGMEAKLEWKYQFSNRNQFLRYSPIWYVIAGGDSQTELAYEDGNNGWQWTISQQCPAGYRERIRKEDQATLVISNVKVQDSGLYGCGLKLSGGTTTKSEARLVVFDAHFTKEPSAVITVTAGQDIRLGWDYIVNGGRDIAFSVYSPTWSLSQDGADIELASENKAQNWAWGISESCPADLRGRIRKELVATLVISKATEMDSGYYSCSLMMVSGKPVVSTVQVIVQKGVKSIEVKFTKTPPNRVYANAGETVNLEWEYEIVNGTKEEAFKRYSPTWNLYQAQQNSIQLAADDKNSQWAWSVSSTCPASLRDRLSKPAKAHLVITSVQTSDAGNYGCTLDLLNGKALTEKTELVVQVSPPCKATAEMVFIIDATNEENFNYRKSFVKRIIHGFEVSQDAIRVGLVVYNAKATVVFSTVQYYDTLSIIGAIDQVKHSQYEGAGNNIGKALNISRMVILDEAGRADVARVVVVMADSASDDDTVIATNLLKKGYTLIYSIGIGIEVNNDELQNIATSPANLFNVGSAKDLGQIVKKVKTQICNELNAVPPPTPKPPPPCKAIVDIVFLMDGSSSILTNEFELCKKFVKDVIAYFTISKEGTHVGAAQFADYPAPIFGLDKYFSNDQVYQAIDSVIKTRGGTFLGDALAYVDESVFGAVQPRPGVPRILIVMTDGKSEDELTIPVEALQKHATIFALGIGDSVKTSELNLMASDPDSEHAFKTGFSQLSNVVDVIGRKACPDKKTSNEEEEEFM